MKQIKILFQRLVSIDWKTAGVEVTLALGCISAIYADFRSKDFTQAIQDVQTLWVPVGILLADVRLILSSNAKAIANPAIPQITGQ